MVLMRLEGSVTVFFVPKHVFDHLTAGGALWVVEIRLVVVLCDRAASAEVNDIVGTVFWCQVAVYLGDVSSQREKWPRCAFKCLFSADTYVAYGLGLVRVDSQLAIMERTDALCMQAGWCAIGVSWHGSVLSDPLH